MPTFQKILSAKHIEFPEYHQVYSISQLGNFIDYRSKQMTASASFRLQCLDKNESNTILITQTLMNATFDIDQDVLDAVKKISKETHQKPDKVLSDLARSGICQNFQAPSKKIRGGFGVIPAKDRVVTTAMIDKLLEESETQ